MTAYGPIEAAADYLELIAEDGEMIALRRAGIADKSVRAAVVDVFPSVELSGGVQQGRRMAIVLADDVTSAAFPLPFREEQDRVIWSSGQKNTVICNVATRRVGGVIIAYELTLEGA